MSSSSDILASTVAADASKEPGSPATKFLIAGVIFTVLSLIGLWMGNTADPSRPFLGYLLGVSFWLSILIGMLFLVMIFWMFDAGWAVLLRRQMEHALAAMPWMGLLLLPLMVMSLLKSGDGSVAWIWMNPDALVPGGHGTVSQDVLYVHKSPYLAQTFFVVRFFLVFGVFILLAHSFRKWSFAMDVTGDHSNVHKSRRLAAAGLFLLAFAATIAAVDWFKSLSYHWFSTMYGVWFFAACMRAALSATVLMGFYMLGRSANGLKGILKPVHLYLVACIMLAFTVFWAYISFSQYFLIYNANIPEETFWYNIRELAKDGTKSSWWWVSMGLIFMHFFFPFLFLLWYKNKFGVKLKFIAVWILIFHLLDLYWNIVPQKLYADNPSNYTVRQFGVSWVDVAMLIGVGGIFIWAYLRSAERHRQVPIRDPRINESLQYHE